MKNDKEHRDATSVLIEKYNLTPQEPLKGNRRRSTTNYHIEFTRDCEEICIEEDHFDPKGEREGERELEIRIGTVDHDNVGKMTVARLKIKEYRRNSGDLNPEPVFEEIGCHDFSSKSTLEHQLKCLHIGIKIVNELYASYLQNGTAVMNDI